MDRRREAGVLLAWAALALLVLAVLAINLARVGSAISREVQRVQADYMHRMGSGEPVEHNALLLGQCVRREMLRSARAGFVQPDTWAFSARIRALPVCTKVLPALPPQRPPVITTPRVRPIVASAPRALSNAHPAAPGNGR